MSLARLKKEKRVPLSTTINKDISEKLDTIAAERGWSRPQAARHLLNGLIRSLEKTGGKWRTIDELHINSAFGEFEKRA